MKLEIFLRLLVFLIFLTWKLSLWWKMKAAHGRGAVIGRHARADTCRFQNIGNMIGQLDVLQLVD